MSSTPYACPCCGSRIAAPPPAEALVELELTPRQREMLDVLIVAYPRAVSVARIHDFIYQLRPGDPPEEPIIRQFARQLRIKLRGTGWEIPNQRGGPKTGTYRLAKEMA